jgi:hypothetical protein
MDEVMGGDVGQVRPLHEVFASLGGEPDAGAALAASGHDLPPDLLTEAVASYADTAPPEVAEHLAPVVLGPDDPGLALELLSSAPQVTWDDVPEPEAEVDEVALPEATDAVPDDLPDLDLDLDFGAGGAVDDLDAPEEPDGADAPEPVADASPVTGEVSLPEPDDDLPHPDLASEGWADDAWDDDADDAPDDDLDG